MVYLTTIKKRIKLESRYFDALVVFGIAVMILSSPLFAFVNPAEAATSAPTISAQRIDSSIYHSNPQIQEAASSSSSSSAATPVATAPSTISQDGDFSTQAALQLTRATQTNNFVNSKSYYDIMFRTATAGVIKTIEMDFPTGTSVGSALIVEATGIGPGTLAASAGEVLTYTVTNAVNVPALTNIRIQISNVNNPPDPNAALTVSITTRDGSNAIIDGPTTTSAYNIKQVATADVANNAITTPKIADSAITSGKIADGNVGTTDLANLAVSSGKLANNAVTTFKVSTGFMKHVTLADDAVGNGRGWNPNGATTGFNIDDPDIDNAAFDFVILELNDVGASTTNAICGVTDISINGDFDMDCNIAPANGIELHYILATVQADT